MKKNRISKRIKHISTDIFQEIMIINSKIVNKKQLQSTNQVALKRSQWTNHSQPFEIIQVEKL